MSDIQKKSGPKPERLKINENWKDAMGKALKKKRPADGWPEPDNKKDKKEPD